MHSPEDSDASQTVDKMINDKETNENIGIADNVLNTLSKEDYKKSLQSLNEDVKSNEASTSSSSSSAKNASEPSVKMAGYLEKRGKMKLVSPWRRYWFVLEGRLLLYFKSQMDYAQGLSACRGSLNMGLANAVRPGSGNHATSVIEVVTRTQVLILKTKDRGTQEKWLQALLDSMALPNVIPSTSKIAGGTSHFRYSLDNLPTQVMIIEKDINSQKEKEQDDNHILERMKRIGGQNYYAGGSLENIILKSGSTSSQANLPKIDAVQRIHDRLNNSSESINKDNDIVIENTFYDKSTKRQNEMKENKQEFSPPEEYNEIITCRSDVNNDNSEVNNNSEQKDYIKETAEASTNTENEYVEEDYEQTPLNINLDENTITTTKEDENKTENEEEEYAYYDSAAISKVISEEPEIPPRHESSEYHQINKQKHRKQKFKLKLNRKKSESRELSENIEDLNHSPKRRLSFLSKMFKRGRRSSHNKLSNNNNNLNDSPTSPNCPQSDSSSEPEYESVDYQAAMLGLPASKGLNDEQKLTIPRVPYGQNGWLTEETLAELSSKIKQNKVKSDQVSEKSWEELHSPESIKKQSEEMRMKLNDSSSSTPPPPSLPPRKENPRPASPWHDVPTNNSPVNFNSDAYKQSITKFAEWNLDLQDNILGTPEGFQYIKNKWQNVEKSGYCNKFQSQVSFPNKQIINIDTNIKKSDDDDDDNKGPVYLKENLVNINEELPKIPIKKIIEKYEKIPTHLEEKEEEEEEEVKDDKHSLSDESLIDSLNPGQIRIENDCDRDSIDEGDVNNFSFKNEQIKHRPRYSDELDVLLSQLAEISSAPVLKPGVTCSLVEVGVNALLGPPRRRRHSDPDYDIPRPIRAIALNKEEISDEECLDNNKFKPSERNVKPFINSEPLIDTEISWNISMTPDSLEPVPLF